MRAFKFLDYDGGTAISGFRWPRPDGHGPGPWVEATAVRPCRAGIHACRPGELAYWLHQELWEIELDGDIVEADRKVVARRGRLVRHVSEWAGGASGELAAWSAWQARDAAVGVLADRGDTDWAQGLANAAGLEELAAVAHDAASALGEEHSSGVVAGLTGDAAIVASSPLAVSAPFVAACVAGHAASQRSASEADYRRGYAVARRAQSEWIVTRLQLT